MKSQSFPIGEFCISHNTRLRSHTLSAGTEHKEAACHIIDVVYALRTHRATCTFWYVEPHSGPWAKWSVIRNDTACTPGGVGTCVYEMRVQSVLTYHFSGSNSETITVDFRRAVTSLVAQRRILKVRMLPPTGFVLFMLASQGSALRRLVDCAIEVHPSKLPSHPKSTIYHRYCRIHTSLLLTCH